MIHDAYIFALIGLQISQAASEVAFDKLRAEVQVALERKADNDALIALQGSKLDISVYEAGARDIKKFRTMLEQNLRDLFTDFASRIEHQVKLKLSIDDFNRIFDPEANGQKAAIENAAARIAQMHGHIERLQEYVDGDHDRQLKMTKLDNGLHELTQKQAECETSLSQLQVAVSATRSDLSMLDSKSTDTNETLGSWITTVQDSKHDQMIVNAALHDKQNALTDTVSRTRERSEQQEKAITDLRMFTEKTLVHDFQHKLERIKADLTLGVDQVATKHRSSAQQVAAELLRINEKLLVGRDQTTQLDALTRRLAARLQELKDDLAYVKDPLATLAANLKEENETIVAEIHRSRVNRLFLVMGDLSCVHANAATVLSLTARIT